MREIKFRGVNKDTSEFVFGGYCKMISGPRLYNAIIAIEDGELVEYYIHDSKTIGQFTGTKDIYGKDIYEGDILLAEGDIFPAVVMFNEPSLGWAAQCYYKGEKNKLMSLVSYIRSRELAVKARVKVIGNIHEDPDLTGDAK